MAMTASAIRFYADRERDVYQNISDMNEVLCVKPAGFESISAKYLDAVFATMIHDDMVCGIRDIRNIVRKVHVAITDG